MSGVNRLVPVDTVGVRSTNVKILMGIAASLGWQVHRHPGVKLTAPGGDVLMLPDNANIRESLFAKALRQIVALSDKQGTPYLCEDVIKTYKPDASTRTRLQREFGVVQKPEKAEPEPIAAVRLDPPPKPELPEVKLTPHIVKRGFDGAYVSEFLLDDEEGNTYCSVCQKPIAPQGAGTHFKAMHPTFRPSAETLARHQKIKEMDAKKRERRARKAAADAEKQIRKAEGEVLRVQEAGELIVNTRGFGEVRLPQQTPPDVGPVFRDSDPEAQLAAIINVVAPSVNKLLIEATAEIKRLQAEVTRLTSERQALREMLS